MKPAKKRLGFIDAARSIAIIQMLQGHFISTTYKDYTTMAHNAMGAGSSGNVFFDVWFFLRGFTAPLFFTITGLVFTYLLLRERDKPFWKQIRVRKGIKRGFEVMFWGYFLALNYRNLDYYLRGHINDRFFGFHVLQSIGFALFVLIFIYGLTRFFKHVRISIVLFVATCVVLLLSPHFAAMGDNYFPANAHPIIQNMFHGPNSFFPLFPWLGYVLAGATIGAILQERKEELEKKWVPLRYALIGIGICLFAIFTVHFLNWLLDPDINYVSISVRFRHFATAIVLLLGLLYLERSEKLRIPFLVEMGKNTLNIYIIHVMLLYGAVIGIGIKSYYDKALSFPMAVLGAILFILFFGVMTYVQNEIKKWWRNRKTVPETTEK